MRLLTPFELASKSDTELFALLRAAFNEAALTSPQTQLHTKAHVQIENIRKELCGRWLHI